MTQVFFFSSRVAKYFLRIRRSARVATHWIATRFWIYSDGARVGVQKSGTPGCPRRRNSAGGTWYLWVLKVWSLWYVTVPMPDVWRWLLVCWKICPPLVSYRPCSALFAVVPALILKLPAAAIAYCVFLIVHFSCISFHFLLQISIFVCLSLKRVPRNLASPPRSVCV